MWPERIEGSVFVIFLCRSLWNEVEIALFVVMHILVVKFKPSFYHRQVKMYLCQHERMEINKFMTLPAQFIMLNGFWNVFERREEKTTYFIFENILPNSIIYRFQNWIYTQTETYYCPIQTLLLACELWIWFRNRTMRKKNTMTEPEKQPKTKLKLLTQENIKYEVTAQILSIWSSCDASSVLFSLLLSSSSTLTPCCFLLPPPLPSSSSSSLSKCVCVWECIDCRYYFCTCYL